MGQIPPHLLWLGHAGDARDLRQLFAAGIRARVELAAEEAPAPTPRDLIACRFPLVDGGGNDAAVLVLALRTVSQLLEQKITTLVCCGAGMSRSPAIAAGAIALLAGEHPEDCLRHVVSHRPADVVPALWSEVARAVISLQANRTQ
jgi:protein-tyrosine phosphatase